MMQKPLPQPLTSSQPSASERVSSQASARPKAVSQSRSVFRKVYWAGLLGVAGFAMTSLAAVDAQAIGPLEIPDNGVQQLGRGGAWVARASNSLAVYYNPAALSGLRSGATLGTNLVFQKVCFQRLGTDGANATTDGGVEYAEICNANSGTPNPVPHLLGNYRLTERLGIGLGILPPASPGKLEFSKEGKGLFRGQEVTIPAAQRYLSLTTEGVLLNPVLSLGYAVTDQLRLGAGFVFGFGNLKLSNTAMAQPGDTATRDDIRGDVLAEVDVTDSFIPGGIFGALFSVNQNIDLGLSVHIQDAFRGKGDLTTRSGYWLPTGGVDPEGGVPSSSSSRGEDLTEVTLPNPMQVRFGVAYRQPRNNQPGFLAANAERDPISQDVFDVELNLEYTQSSALDAIQVRVPKDTVFIYSRSADGQAVEVGPVPQNSDVDLKMKDSFGVRLGGDYVVLPNQLSVRAGGWFQTAASDAEYLHISPVAGPRFGLAVGAQYRISPVDIELGYSRMVAMELDNGGDGKIKTVSGRPDLGDRSPYAVNGGRVNGGAHIVALGVSAQF